MQRSIFVFLEQLMRWHRYQKIVLAIFIDLSLICVAFVGAFFIRLEDLSLFNEARYGLILLALCCVCIAAFFKMGVYHTLLRFISMHGLMMIALGACIGGFSIAIFGYFSTLFIPRTIPIIFTLLFFVMASGVRFTLRYLYAFLASHAADKVILYGSQAACNQLISSLGLSEKYHVCGIFNEDFEKGTLLRGIRVYPITFMEEFIERYQPTCLVLANSDIQENQREFLLRLIEQYPLQLRRMISADDTHRHRISFQDSEIITLETLMERAPVTGFDHQIQEHLTGRCILVTGAGGSIGSEICKQVIKVQPCTLVLFEVNEFALYEVQRKIETLNSNVTLIPVLGNIQQYTALVAALEKYQVDIVYHAAAYKHVALVEENPLQAVENNVLGTWNVARATVEAQVKQCVLISSDKAVRPTSFMGATKRIAELIMQYYALANTTTRFNSVRFGNVMGSSGSVIPLFQQQIAQGGPVTVTHPQVERFFMTIAEASHLVLQASALSTQNGEVFVLDMGKPVRILDLAKKLIRFSGHTVHSNSNPKGDIKIVFTGLKAGEKIHEELFITSRVLKTAHPKILCTLEKNMETEHLLQWLHELSSACERRDEVAILTSMQKHALDIGYDPDMQVAPLPEQRYEVREA